MDFQAPIATSDYVDLRNQIKDFKSTFYGPHTCEGCGQWEIIKKSFEEGGESWERVSENPLLYKPHNCTHVFLFKKLMGRVLTVLDAALSNNAIQHKAVIDLVKQEFSSIIYRVRELESDNNIVESM